MNGGRLVRASFLGLFINGLFTPYYYNAIQTRIPGRDPASVAVKVLCDAGLWGFGMNAAVMTVRLAIEGTPFREAFRIAKEEIPQVFKSDLCVWMTYNSMCYGVIPRGIQPISTAVMSSLWTAYVTFVSVGKHPV